MKRGTIIVRHDEPVEPEPAVEHGAAECSGMRFLGHHGLGGNGNCGEGTALLERGGRRYLYPAHENGPRNFSALGATRDEVAHVAMSKGPARHFLLAVSDHNANAVDRRMRCQSVDSMGQHRFSGQGAKLFGVAAAQTAAGAGGDYEGDHGHRRRLARFGAFL